MPFVFRYKGNRFFFYSNEGDPREPVHIHVSHDDMEAKFWLHPARLASNKGFSSKALRELQQLIEIHTDLIERSWNDFFRT